MPSAALGPRSSESANAPANGRAPVSKKKKNLRRESLHIKDATAWPDPKEALTAVLQARQEAKNAVAARLAAEEQAEAIHRAAEERLAANRRVAEEKAEAERRAAADKAEAERRMEEDKARQVIEALEAADAERSRLEAEAVARREAKKKAKADALERKARRLSAAQWAEPSAELAVWPAEFAPMPSQPEEEAEESISDGAPPPQHQRYAGRLARARSSNRQAMMSRARAASSSSVSSEDTPAPVEEPKTVEDMPAPVEDMPALEESVKEPAPEAPVEAPVEEVAPPASVSTITKAEPLAATDAPAPASASKPKKGSAKDLIARFNTKAA